MARYTQDPTTGEKTLVSGTNYIPPCLAKTASRKADSFIPAPIVETTKDADEATHENTD